MADSNRGKYYSIGLGAALAISVVTGVALWHDASTQQTRHEVEAQDRAADYANSARIEAQNACIAAEASPLAECVEEGDDGARLDQRGEYDLEAQRTMAVWTRAMGLAAIIGMAVGMFGVGLIWATFRETREGAKAALAQVGLLKEAQRPDLHLLKFLLVHEASQQLLSVREGFPNLSYAQLIFKNHGVGTATIIDVRYGYTVAKACPDEVAYERQAPFSAGTPIVPDGFTPVVRAQIDVTDAEIERLKADDVLFFWLKGEFSDGYGGTHSIGIGAYWAGELAGRNLDDGFEMIPGGFWATVPGRTDLNFRTIRDS